jgi:hypothetical protein
LEQDVAPFGQLLGLSWRQDPGVPQAGDLEQKLLNIAGVAFVAFELQALGQRFGLPLVQNSCDAGGFYAR